jgi:homoaconitate hydratase
MNVALIIKLFMHKRLNRIQKIVSKFSLDKSSMLSPGDFVSIQPSHVMTHDNTGAVLKKYSITLIN